VFVVWKIRNPQSNNRDLSVGWNKQGLVFGKSEVQPPGTHLREAG